MKPRTRPSTMRGQVRLERIPSLSRSCAEWLRGFSFRYSRRSSMMRGRPVLMTRSSELPRRSPANPLVSRSRHRCPGIVRDHAVAALIDEGESQAVARDDGSGALEEEVGHIVQRRLRRHLLIDDPEGVLLERRDLVVTSRSPNGSKKRSEDCRLTVRNPRHVRHPRPLLRATRFAPWVRRMVSHAREQDTPHSCARTTAAERAGRDVSGPVDETFPETPQCRPACEIG